MEQMRPGERMGGDEPDIAAKAGAVLRRAAVQLRSSGVLERDRLRPLQFVPSQLDGIGEYLERRRLQGIRVDAERVIVSRPAVALLLAAFVGYAAGRAVRR